MKQLKEINGEKVLEFKGHIFIIPNAPSTYREFIGDAAEAKRLLADAIIKATHPEMDEMDDTDLLIQVWIESMDELGTDNLVDHGGLVLDTDNKKIWFRPCGLASFEFLPLKIFEGKKEGEVVDIIVPKYKVYKVNDKEKKSPEFVKVIMHLELAQTKYRYQNHGRFEELLKKMKNYKKPAVAVGV